MTLPPSVLRIRVINDKKRFSIWLPLFLVWPLVLAVALVLSPLIIVLSVVLWHRGLGKTLLLSGPLFFALFSELRGLEIDVQNGPETVLVYFR